MAQNGTRKEAVALLLAGGATVTQAARRCQVGRRTIHRWLADDSEFRVRVAELRTNMLDRATGRLSRLAGRAAGVLARLLRSEDERIALAAAKTALDAAVKLREATELQHRLDELERQMTPESGNGLRKGDVT